MKVTLLLALGCIAVGGLGDAHAQRAAAPCDASMAEAQTARIRTHLDDEHRRGRRWDLGWAIGLGVVAVGEAGLALTDTAPLGGEYTDALDASLWIGSIKSTLGVIARGVVGMKVVRVGAATGDACADLAAAERALRETAKHEKVSFFLTHAAGVVLNAAGALYLGLHEDDWGEAAVSTALGYPVSLAIAYTQPRRSWKAVRDGSLLAPTASTVTWRADPVHSRAFTGMVVRGAF